MVRKKAAKTGTEASNVKPNVRQLVLHEAGYKCANPACRYPLTLDVHHLYYVSEGGSDNSENLLPLCPNCHTEHHHGHIPTESLRAWKMLLIALNEAFDHRSVDILLVLAELSTIESVTGDGIPPYTPLAASGLATISVSVRSDCFVPGGSLIQVVYRVTLTEKGRMFVAAWKKGDQRAALDFTRPTSEKAQGGPPPRRWPRDNGMGDDAPTS